MFSRLMRMRNVLFLKPLKSPGFVNPWVWIVSCIVSIQLFCIPQAGHGAEPGSWNHFKSHFINADGRVVDYHQQKISHSEGQGYAMLIAVQSNDQKMFNILWKWTKNNLQVRNSDALICWSWGKRPTGEWTVLDHNNATDGDIFIAYALLSAFEKWQIEGYKREALRIIDSIKSKLIIHRYGKTVVLPGYHGFVRDTDLIMNPSYWVFSAFLTFAKYQDRNIWLKVYDDALSMIREYTFSDLNLPPDWLLFGKDGGAVFSERSVFCGFDAIRVFLFLALDNKLGQLPGTGKLLDRIEQIRFVPMSFDLTRNTASFWNGPAGFYAVMARSADSLGKKSTATWLWKEAKTRLKSEPRNYYSHTLYLLASPEVRP